MTDSRLFKRFFGLVLLAFGLPGVEGVAFCSEGPDARQMEIQITFGHRAAVESSLAIELLPGSEGLDILQVEGHELEAGESLGPSGRCRVGAGDVDGVRALLSWPEPRAERRKPHEIWEHLLAHTASEARRRLQADPAFVSDAPLLTVRTGDDGTTGFTIGLLQLRDARAMWLPEQDAFVTVGDEPVDHAEHRASLRGLRVLERVKQEPEATLAEYAESWEDVGDPRKWNVPWQTSWLGATGHIVGVVPAHGSLAKFGVDRWGNVRPDLAASQKFRFDIAWPGSDWVAQRIHNGLPFLITSLERGGQTCEIEQFAAPLAGSVQEQTRPDDVGVLLTRIRLSGAPGRFRIEFRLAGEPGADVPLSFEPREGSWSVVEPRSGNLWLLADAGPGSELRAVLQPNDAPNNSGVSFSWVGELTAGESRQVVLRLGAPPVGGEDWAALSALDFSQAREAMVKYWEEWLAQGAHFEVPEAAVNNLFRANLWHALRLPRIHPGSGEPPTMDLPYSNFAYGQRNADWPVNQAVYVDYMLYGLRGHFAVADAEFASMFRTQQQPDGRIGGFANWGVYSPSMLYAIGCNYLLSRDRASFQRLLPQALEALDWCLANLAKARDNKQAPGLILAPLNDLTHEERVWAFNQAYYVAGLEMFGRALAVEGHVKAEEVRCAAEAMRRDVERAFAQASVKSPVVQLGDGSWIQHVPSDALTPRRLLEQWYPTDVDTGPLHLVRLSALDPKGHLATAMLHDHEDNLFLNQWGAANEPVYNQQATVYLLRDEPEAAIRSFYSMMACAFSRGQLEPIEHRWAWGQYFGPPSTDGAWFELYRNLLLADNGAGLLVGQATPRGWLGDGKSISIERAPTWSGPVNVHIQSRAAAGTISAKVEFLSDRRPPALRVRLRHPSKARLRWVELNGSPWMEFDPSAEWIDIPGPKEAVYRIVAHY